jgi:hypothetical protein
MRRSPPAHDGADGVSGVERNVRTHARAGLFGAVRGALRARNDLGRPRRKVCDLPYFPSENATRTIRVRTSGKQATGAACKAGCIFAMYRGVLGVGGNLLRRRHGKSPDTLGRCNDSGSASSHRGPGYMIPLAVAPAQEWLEVPRLDTDRS